ANYVPGQDPIGSSAMYQNCADAYIVAAKNALQAIQQPMATLQLSNKHFTTQYKAVNNGFLDAQAALYAQKGSAYDYAQLSQNQTLAHTIQSMYVDLYNQQI